MNWVILCIVTIISWGLVGFFDKLALSHLHWTEIYVVSNLAILAASLLIYISQKPSISVGSAGFNYAMIAGIMMALSTIAFYVALQTGKAVIVIPLTSLYPVVTIVLSYLILHEQISLTKGVGITLAVVALVLIALE
jgi:transporter family protein